MKKPLSKALRSILDSTIDASISRKQRLRTEAEDRLQRIECQEQVATEDLVALFRGVLALQQQAESICADRYNLVRY